MHSDSRNTAADATVTPALWLCNGAMMAVALGLILVPIYLTTFRQAFAVDGVPLSEEQLGRIPAVLFGWVTVGILFSGPLADRWGAKLFAVAGLVLVSLGLVVTATATSYAALLVGASVTGLGAGIIDMVLSPIVSALQPHRRSAALNVLHSFYCVGAVLTTVLGYIAIRGGIGWRWVCLIMTLFPALVALGLMRVSIPPVVEAGQARQPARTLLRSPYFLIAFLAMFLAGATELGIAQWLPAFAELHLGFEKQTSALTLSMFLVAMAVGRLWCARLVHRFPVFHLMIAGCIFAVVLYGVGCFATNRYVAITACIGVGLAVSLLWPSMLGVTADQFPHGGATMFGLMAAAGNASGFAVPWLIGIVAGYSHLGVGLLVGTVCPLILVFLLLWMRGHQPRNVD